MEYPNLDKKKEVMERTYSWESLCDLYDFLQQKYNFMKWDDDIGYFTQQSVNPERDLAEWAGIDYDEMDRETRALIDSLRAGQ